MRRRVILAAGLACLVAPRVAAADPPAEKAKPASASAPALPVVDEAPVVVWNRTIAILRAPYGQLSPAERARAAERRIREIPEGEPSYRVAGVAAKVEGGSGVWITVNDRPVLGLFTADADLSSGETFAEYEKATIGALEAWLAARAEQRRWPLLLRGIALSLLATILWIVAVVMVVRLRRRWRLRAASARRHVMVGDVDLRPHIIKLESGLLGLASWAVGLALGYVWLAFVLGQFPYSRPWARSLRDFLFDLVADFTGSVVGALPNLVKVFFILLVTRVVSRGLSAFFRAAETGALKSTWLEPETARATRRLVVVVIWLFALVLAYPYIPGSDTLAFQGLSVILGIMVSLGATGLVGQIIGGLVMVYTRAFHIGDLVKVDEHEGVVLELGMLSTKILTVRNEEVTIPNAVLVATTSMNFSRRSELEGSVVATKLTIGYDAPWRQVHSMLLRAAARTDGVRSDPAPRVLQRSLSDFYVEYALFFNIDRAEQRYAILSDLHGNIQDAFNEFGVQIMSPNFEYQPDQPVVVPRSRWYAAPAEPEPAGADEGDDGEAHASGQDGAPGRPH